MSGAGLEGHLPTEGRAAAFPHRASRPTRSAMTMSPYRSGLHLRLGADFQKHKKIANRRRRVKKISSKGVLTHTYIYVHVGTHSRIPMIRDTPSHTHSRIPTHTHMCIHTIHTHAHIRTLLYTHTYTRPHTHTHTCPHTHTLIYMPTHTPSHTHTHTPCRVSHAASASQPLLLAPWERRQLLTLLEGIQAS